MNKIDHDDDINFEQELSRHLAGQLDPQCGRAARAFEAHLRAERRGRGGNRWLRVAAVFVIVSAGVAAFVWVEQTFLIRRPAQFVNTTPPAVVPVHPALPVTTALESSSSSSSPRDVTQLTTWAASDEGVETITLADEQMPVRKVRRDALETTQWFDPQTNAQIKLTVPVEQEILIQQDTY
jgi:hypothetical protein